MKLSPNLVVALSAVVGVVLGVLIGLSGGDARVFGALGALVGFAVGCALTVIPPMAAQDRGRPPVRWPPAGA